MGGVWGQLVTPNDREGPARTKRRRDIRKAGAGSPRLGPWVSGGRGVQTQQEGMRSKRSRGTSQAPQGRRPLQAANSDRNIYKSKWAPGLHVCQALP